LLQVDGREIAIDHNDGEISQGRGGEILEQELLRPKAVHQEAKTAPAAEHYIHSLRSVFSTSTSRNEIRMGDVALVSIRTGSRP
jgi:hypothetical protein